MIELGLTDSPCWTAIVIVINNHTQKDVLKRDDLAAPDRINSQLGSYLCLSLRLRPSVPSATNLFDDLQILEYLPSYY